MFILETLRSGSIINNRQFLTEDQMQVTIQTTTVVELLELTPALLLQLMDNYEVFKKKEIQSYQHQLLKQNLKYPLDFLPSYEWLNCG